MWSDGVFGDRIDAALLLTAAGLCLWVAWGVHRRVGTPRFPGAVGVLWLLAVVALPVPTYFNLAIGMWMGAAFFEQIGLGAVFGAALGMVLGPPLFCYIALSSMAAVLSERRVSR